ncbi:hypothetical protein [Moorena sp. SIO4G3]|uniref:hypothetical protein n=1 Tax=Moorena sp. SIO4G3 TaxID=2607821 RepID=UPI0025DEC1C6|nr:hypothetical protein [Moorena sp. SIO4G3]
MVGSAYQADPIQINHSQALPTLHLDLLHLDLHLDQVVINPMVGSAYQADPIQINHSQALPTLHLFSRLVGSATKRSPSPHLPISLSPHLPISPSPYSLLPTP